MGNNWRVVMTQSIPSIGQTYQNVVHFYGPGGAGDTAQALAAELTANFMPKIANFQSWFLGWQFLHIYNAESSGTPVYIHPLNNYGGLAQEGYVYPTLCYKISVQSTVGGRAGRGRFFVAGGRASWMTAGGITQSAATNGGAQLTALIARYSNTGTSSFKWCLIHKDAQNFIVKPMTSLLLRPYMGMQRRRNYGVGV